MMSRPKTLTSTIIRTETLCPGLVVARRAVTSTSEGPFMAVLGFLIRKSYLPEQPSTTTTTCTSTSTESVGYIRSSSFWIALIQCVRGDRRLSSEYRHRPVLRQRRHPGLLRIP